MDAANLALKCHSEGSARLAAVACDGGSLAKVLHPARSPLSTVRLGLMLKPRDRVAATTRTSGRGQAITASPRGWRDDTQKDGARRHPPPAG